MKTADMPFQDEPSDEAEECQLTPLQHHRLQIMAWCVQHFAPNVPADELVRSAAKIEAYILNGGQRLN